MKWRRRKKTKDRHQEEEEGWRQDSWRKDIRKARKNDHYLRMETFGHQVLHLRKKIGAANLTKINHRRHREVLALSSFFIMFLSLSLLFWDINFFTWTSYGLCTISCCCCITERKTLRSLKAWRKRLNQSQGWLREKRDLWWEKEGQHEQSKRWRLETLFTESFILIFAGKKV